MKNETSPFKKFTFFSFLLRQDFFFHFPINYFYFFFYKLPDYILGAFFWSVDVINFSLLFFSLS